MPSWICQIFCSRFVFQDFSSLGLNGHFNTWPLHLPPPNCASLDYTYTWGTTANDRLRSYFRMYVEEDFLQTALSPSVNTSDGVCPSILTIQFLFALLYLSSSTVFYLPCLCLQPCWQTKVYFPFIRLKALSLQ